MNHPLESEGVVAALDRLGAAVREVTDPHVPEPIEDMDRALMYIGHQSLKMFKPEVAVSLIDRFTASIAEAANA